MIATSRLRAARVPTDFGAVLAVGAHDCWSIQRFRARTLARRGTAPLAPSCNQAGEVMSEEGAEHDDATTGDGEVGFDDDERCRGSDVPGDILGEVGACDGPDADRADDDGRATGGEEETEAELVSLRDVKVQEHGDGDEQDEHIDDGIDDGVCQIHLGHIQTCAGCRQTQIPEFGHRVAGEDLHEDDDDHVHRGNVNETNDTVTKACCWIQPQVEQEDCDLGEGRCGDVKADGNIDILPVFSAPPAFPSPEESGDDRHTNLCPCLISRYGHVPHMDAAAQPQSTNQDAAEDDVADPGHGDDDILPSNDLDEDSFGV